MQGFCESKQMQTLFFFFFPHSTRACTNNTISTGTQDSYSHYFYFSSHSSWTSLEAEQMFVQQRSELHLFLSRTKKEEEKKRRVEAEQSRVSPSDTMSAVLKSTINSSPSHTAASLQHDANSTFIFERTAHARVCMCAAMTLLASPKPLLQQPS